MAEVQNLEEYCLKCKYEVPTKFATGEIGLDVARKTCANCKFGKQGIYKFDIVYTLWGALGKLKSIPERPKGKKATYTKRYGVAVERLQAEGKTVREIAEILGISPTSVIKVSKELRADRDKAAEAL